MKLAIVGSRDFNDYEFVSGWIYSELDIYFEKGGSASEITIISGGCRGVDKLAARWAKENGCQLIELEADWNKYDKAAGPIRNQQIIDLKPDFMIAFMAEKSKGTKDIVQRALKNMIPVLIVPISEANET